MQIEHAHQPGPVCARFAVHQNGILDPLEQVAGRLDGFA
jgi:hypothetical protein